MLLWGLVAARPAAGQFVETFEDSSLAGWTHQTGDGEVSMTVTAGEGMGELVVDATEDRHNIWWAFLARDVSSSIDLARLNEPGNELRVTARVRPSHAPRRVNLHVNTQETTDFHSHLMEYDLSDTTRWHTLSMTTEGFEVTPGDTVTAQLAMMDWGSRTYRLAIDSFAVEVVDRETAPPNLGSAVPYPLPTRAPETLSHHVPATAGGLVHRDYPGQNFAGWHTTTDTTAVPTWTVAPGQMVILRWDRDALPADSVTGPGVLELRRHSVHRADVSPEELGQVRVVEVMTGPRDWTRETLTYDRLTRGRPLNDLLNPQPIVDVDVSGPPGGTVRIPISESVLRRLVTEETKGLALRPLGPTSATFFAPQSNESTHRPVLHLDTASTKD